MTDGQIIQAFECCVNPKVGQQCPRQAKGILCNDGCKNFLMMDVVDLISRMKAENERLKALYGDNC